MDNQHRKIKGYRDLTQDEIDLMNRVKNLAEEVGEIIGELNSTEVVDKRCVALAKTNLQQGFMWAVRSIAQPGSF